jgi:hypothetical protein
MAIGRGSHSRAGRHAQRTARPAGQSASQLALSEVEWVLAVLTLTFKRFNPSNL